MKLSLAASVLAAAGMAAAQNLNLIAGSCVANDLLAATAASGNPCPATDYLCQCTKGHDFLENQLTSMLLKNQGSCTAADIEGLPALAEQFCESVPGYNGTSYMSSVISGLPAESTSIAAEIKSVEAALGSTLASGSATTTGSGSGSGSTTATGTAASSTGAAGRRGISGAAGLLGAAVVLVL